MDKFQHPAKSWVNGVGDRSTSKLGTHLDFSVHNIEFCLMSFPLTESRVCQRVILDHQNMGFGEEFSTLLSQMTTN